MPEPTNLADLARRTGAELRGDGATVIADVTHDSRSVSHDTLFVAIRGFTTDGHRFVADLAGVAGAAAVEEWIDADIPQLRVADTRAAHGVLADAVHHHPSRQLTVLGVTGTNGKTTVTYLIEAIAQAAGLVPGRLGTNGASIGGDPVSVARTTPEASDLHRLLADMLGSGVAIAAIEVSSHALALGRVGGVEFAVAAFTNLSQDHLDFHADMEDYFRTKAQLFDGRAAAEVIWVDDAYGRRLFEQRRDHATSVGFDDAQVRASQVKVGLAQSTFVLETPAGEAPVTLPIGGRFNVANGLVAAASALAVNIDLTAIAAGLEAVAPIPGRMEPVDLGQPFSVLVDYAHSPGGVETVVDTARGLAKGRVITVVGAGGDRDRDKRPRMGQAGARGDVLYITSDNPRTEDPRRIIDEVVTGAADGRARVEREVDRRLAIGKAIGEARPGDVVLVLGKGHEPGQDIAGAVHDFDDRVVAAEALTSAGYGA